MPSQYSQGSQLGKRRRPAFTQKSQKPKRRTLYKPRRVIRRPTAEVKCSQGVFFRTRLTNQNGEDQRPWYLIEAATNNKGERTFNQQVINGIKNGVASFERVGRKISNKSLAIRLKIQSGAQRDVAVRYVLVMKKDLDNKSVADQGLATDDNNPFYNRGTDVDSQAHNQAVPSDFANINPIMQWRDLSNVDQFEILLDKTVILRQNWNCNSAPVPDGRGDFVPVANGRWTTDQITDPNPYGAVVTDGVPMVTLYKEHYLDLKGTITTGYDEIEDQASSNQYGYVEKNGLYLIAATDYTTADNLDPAVEISGTYRFRYLD